MVLGEVLIQSFLRQNCGYFKELDNKEKKTRKIRTLETEFETVDFEGTEDVSRGLILD